MVGVRGQEGIAACRAECHSFAAKILAAPNVRKTALRSRRAMDGVHAVHPVMEYGGKGSGPAKHRVPSDIAPLFLPLRPPASLG